MSLNPRDIVVVDCVRTAMAKAKNGAFRHVRAENLSAAVMQALFERNPGLDPAEVDDVIWGCVNQTLEQGYNIARNAAIMTGIPRSVPAQTVNRLCGSSMSALHIAAANIKAGMGDFYVIGGVEHMEHVSMMHGVDVNPAVSKHAAKAAMMMGLTAELLGKMHGVTREDQDKFGVRSHQRAAAASDKGYFDNEIVGVEGHDERGFRQLVKRDEVIRIDASLEEMAKLKPVFDRKTGTVTAGNASTINDGAALLLVMSESRAKELGYEVLAVIDAYATGGMEPKWVMMAPLKAVANLLARTKTRIDDYGLIELNEAFAAQGVALINELKLDPARLNVNGGAVALGHPIGASGARVLTTLVYALRNRNLKRGIATLCLGGGNGVALAVERGFELRQLVGHRSHPVGQSEDLVDDDDDRRLLLHLGVGDEAVDRALAVLDGDPLQVPRRFFEPVLDGILQRQPQQGHAQQGLRHVLHSCS